MIFFTEDVALSTYNRLNLYGVNITNEITVSKLPYLLEGKIFVDIKSKLNERYELLIKDSTNPNIIQIMHSYNKKQQNRLVFWYPINISVVDECQITFICNTESSLECRSYYILIGKAPTKKIVGKIDDSGIIDNNISTTVQKIIDSATDEILIHDTYFNIEELDYLFDKVPNEVSIKIITGPKFIKLKSKNNNVEIKASLKCHDRFIVLDKDQVFIFGNSFHAVLKDPKKYSLYKKLSDKNDIDKIITLFENIWKSS